VGNAALLPTLRTRIYAAHPLASLAIDAPNYLEVFCIHLERYKKILLRRNTLSKPIVNGVFVVVTLQLGYKDNNLIRLREYEGGQIIGKAIFTDDFLCHGDELFEVVHVPSCWRHGL
jgi:hypothetical protein